MSTVYWSEFRLRLCESQWWIALNQQFFFLVTSFFMAENMSGPGYTILLVETSDKRLKLYGSARGDLENADEISEVNGRCLDRWPRHHIADYIRRSILSRTLCLRIKPKKTQESAHDAKIQDTFLISVSCDSPAAIKEFSPILSDDMTQLTSGQVTSTDSAVDPTLVTEQDKSTSTIKDIQVQDGSLVKSLIETSESGPELKLLSKETISVPSTNGNKTDKPLVASSVTDDSAMALVQQAPTVRHREMAVDCPDTFIAVAKTTPKYPPPKKNTNQETSSLKKNGLYYFTSGNLRNHHERSSSSQDGSESSRRTPPTPRISELVQDSSEVDSIEKKNIMSESVVGQTENVTDGLKSLELEHMERIRKYQDDIKKRKEEEERLAQEDALLRSSLRGSKKLRALEKKYFPADPGVENTAFQLEDGDDEIANVCYAGGKLVCDVPEGEPPELTKTYQLSELLDMVKNIGTFLEKTSFDGDVVSLEKLFQSSEFQSSLSLHNKVQELCCFNCLPTPLLCQAHTLSQEVVNDIQDIPFKDAKELIDIMCKTEFENFLLCHDQIADSQVMLDITEEEDLLTRVSQYTEESIKIVRIDKTTEPLGATVKNEGEAVVIGRIVKGGVAEKSGLLHEGDEILEVNGIELRGKSVNDVCDIMANMSGTLTFLLIPSQYNCPKQTPRETVIHLKAHFDYEPDDDLYVPCRELGMSFQKGDVLHVISQEDPNWWQAYREGEEDQMLAGLIPSKSFQQQREIMKQAVVGDVRERKSKKAKFLCARRPHRRKKKKLYNLNYNDDTDSDQILTYEEVYLYYPRAHHRRPLVLIGPQKVGRHELRQRLMEDTNRFAAAVPHTSRPKKDNEVNGVDYHFISRAQFEADILAGRFVEHGEYQKSYYGTSLDAIRSVISAGKTCVLNLHPQSLKILKKSDLKPYVVFIAPPSFEKLRQNCIKTDPTVKDEELKDIIEKAREIEEFYGHFFDLVLINVDLEKTFSELLHAISVIEREPQWIPASWMKDETS